MSESPETFDSVKARIDDILDEVSREDVSLDDALSLYEEAIKLGMAACELSESDIFPPEPEPEIEAQAEQQDGLQDEGAIEGSLGPAGEVEEAPNAADIAGSQEFEADVTNVIVSGDDAASVVVSVVEGEAGIVD